MNRPYLVLDLVDDHVLFEEHTVRRVIGIYVIDGGVPRVVACGLDLPSGTRPKGPLCLNEVRAEGGLEHPHRGHLTRTSVLTLTGEQLGWLHEHGRLDFERAGCYVELLSASPSQEAS